MYKILVGDKVYDQLVIKFDKVNGEDYDDEVAQDTNGSAQFIVKDVVTNVADCSIAQVQNDIASQSTLL